MSVKACDEKTGGCRPADDCQEKDNRRQPPTLTDAERIAIEHGIASLESDEDVYGRETTPYAAALRGLLERL